MGNLPILSSEFQVFDVIFFFIFYSNSSFFKAFKHTDDFGGILELGNYVSGTGDFIAGDPMVFTGGDPINCQGDAGVNGRSSIGYWYCWYDAFDEVVDLNHM